MKEQLIIGLFTTVIVLITIIVYQGIQLMFLGDRFCQEYNGYERGPFFKVNVEPDLKFIDGHPSGGLISCLPGTKS